MVYGFIGVVILVPFIRDYLGGPGLSVLAASIVLGIMVLPTVTSISVDALQAVPRAYREGSIALGATDWQTTHMVMLKAARSGIVAAVILGMGRAVGETMAVIMVAGNTLDMPLGPLDPVRTLTSNIALEMGYAAGDHRQALFATGVVLFVIIMILNTIALTVSRAAPRLAPRRGMHDPREDIRPAESTPARHGRRRHVAAGGRHHRRPGVHHRLHPGPRPAARDVGLPHQVAREHGPRGRRLAR